MNKKNGQIIYSPISLKDAINDGCPPPHLEIRDRIVWLSDNGPEFGLVKWLGKLPDVSNDWMAGVHFDNPVGSGTGLYNDVQLFEAPMNHASLVPVIGLIKAEDYLCGNSLTSNGVTSNSNAMNTVQLGANTTIAAANISNISELNHQSSLLENAPIKPRRLKKRGDEKLIEENLCNNMMTSTQANKLNESNSNKLKEISLHKDSYLINPSTSTSNQLMHSSNSISPITNQNSQISNASGNSQLPLQTLIANSNRKLGKDNELIVSQSKFYDTEIDSGNDLEIGSVVEVKIDSLPRYGVIRWIGSLSTQSEEIRQVAGVELEEECNGCTDGSWNGKRYFTCAPRKGYFVRLNQCKKDSRFTSAIDRRRSLLFGSIDCPTVTGDVPPLSTSEDLQSLCGKNRGIQGHHNSCYLDATLFAMFACTTIFESLLYRPPSKDDIAEYSEVQRVLKEEIINPLRANLYVRADRVMQLRTLLERLSSVRGLTSEEKDPEEFLNLLLNEILKAEPYLKLSSGLESYFYQLFVDKDEKLILPTVQQLFDQSFLNSDIKLREIPPCLLLQMPRFGRQFKMYPRIIPNLYLDITDTLENSPRHCCICGQVAEYECKECFGQFGEGLESTAFCTKCIDKSHGHKKRAKHKTSRLSIPPEFALIKDHTTVQRIYMELFAVLCIETSHYVCFVKCGSGPDAPWCFFDSMADRKGEQNGYNIPEVVSFPDLRWWLSEEGIAFLLTTKDDKVLPEMARRLLCDAYMCFYQSPDMVLYR